MSTESKNLVLARTARDEGNSEQAEKYYTLVLEENVDNPEAKFFAAYYAYLQCDKPSSANKFKVFCNVAPKVVALLPNDDDGVSFLITMYETIKDLPLTAHNVYTQLWQTAGDAKKQEYNEIKKLVGYMGTHLLYDFGDAIEVAFGTNADAMKVAEVAWMKGVAYQQKWPYYKIEKELVAKYTAKIQKLDNSYVAPKKAGCISFG